MLKELTKEQKESLKKLGFEGELVQEGLKFFRDEHNKYVRVNVSAYYVAEVFGYLTIEEQKDGGGDRQYLSGVHSWEEAESLALDYLIKNIHD